ncbi:MAG: transcriptional regulator NrdR [Burkholderiaceae bacterium]
MHCPFCAHPDTQVLETRISEDGASIRRRRRCVECDRRFTTYERFERVMPSVVKSDGSRVEFVRDKLRGSMQLALRKRPVAAQAVDEALQRIEDQLLATGAREIPSSQIGEMVMGELRRLDKVAYVRFASVYRNFEDVDEFAEAILEVQRPRGR